MFAQIISHRRSAFVVVSLISMLALGACEHSVAGPDRAAPTDGMRAQQQRVDYRAAYLRSASMTRIQATRVETRQQLRGF